MLREEKLEDITDGKRYGINDMVRTDTLGCKDCSKCCETMADTIVLSPLDVHNMEMATGKDFNALMEKYIELKMHDGVILPNIKAIAGACVMLKEKRCSIHAARPDFCRLFPMGRLYENDSFSYVLQIGQCEKAQAKIKVKKWIDTPEYDRHSAFVLRWHSIIRNTAQLVTQLSAEGNTEKAKGLIMSLLADFYQKPFEDGYFYEEFDKRATEYIVKYL